MASMQHTFINGAWQGLPRHGPYLPCLLPPVLLPETRPPSTEPAACSNNGAVLNQQDALESLAADVTAMELFLAEQKRHQEPFRAPVSCKATIGYHGFGNIDAECCTTVEPEHKGREQSKELIKIPALITRKTPHTRGGSPVPLQPWMPYRFHPSALKRAAWLITVWLPLSLSPRRRCHSITR